MRIIFHICGELRAGVEVSKIRTLRFTLVLRRTVSVMMSVLDQERQKKLEIISLEQFNENTIEIWILTSYYQQQLPI